MHSWFGELYRGNCDDTEASFFVFMLALGFICLIKPRQVSHSFLEVKLTVTTDTFSAQDKDALNFTT